MDMQAYEGARNFYFCFIPTIMLAILIGLFFILEEYFNQKALNPKLDLADSQLLYSFGLIIASFVAYYQAVEVYGRCNQIDTTPVIVPLVELTEEIRESEGEEGENCLLGSAKPKQL